MSATSQPPQSHLLLIRLIRGLGALFAGGIALTLVYATYSIIAGALHEQMGSLGWFGVFFCLSTMFGFLGLFFAVSLSIFREVNAKTVPEFAALFSLLAAIDFYYWWPLLYPQYSDGKNLSFLVFVFLFRLVKDILLHVLRLGPPSLSSVKPSVDIPEFPKRSPLVGL